MSPYEKQCRLALLKAVYAASRVPSIPPSEINTTYKDAKEVFVETDQAFIHQSLQHKKENTCKLWE